MLGQLTRITVPFEEGELAALAQVARDEARRPQDQARYLIREALQARGFLIVNSTDRPIESPGMQRHATAR